MCAAAVLFFSFHVVLFNFFWLTFQTPGTLCNDELWSVLVVTPAHSASLKCQASLCFIYFIGKGMPQQLSCIIASFQVFCLCVIACVSIKMLRRCVSMFPCSSFPYVLIPKTSHGTARCICALSVGAFTLCSG